MSLFWKINTQMYLNSHLRPSSFIMLSMLLNRMCPNWGLVNWNFPNVEKNMHLWVQNPTQCSIKSVRQKYVIWPEEVKPACMAMLTHMGKHALTHMWAWRVCVCVWERIILYYLWKISPTNPKWPASWLVPPQVSSVGIKANAIWAVTKCPIRPFTASVTS